MTLAALEAQKGKVDREALLGRLLWFQVPDATLLDYQQTLNELGAVGLTKALPKPPKEHDTFRRVSSNAEKMNIAHGTQGGVVENWMVRDVSATDDEIVRRAVVEVRNAKGQELAYEQVVDMVYVRPKGSQTKGRLRFDWLTDEKGLAIPGHNKGDLWSAAEWPYAETMCLEVTSRYSREVGKLAAGVVRTWLTRTIRAMGGTPCRPNGGLYFLEEAFADQVETLEEFCVKHLPSSGECHSVELLNSDKQREMVKKAIERETIGAIEDLTQEINECRRDGKLTSKRFVDIQKRVKAVDNKQGKYMKLLAQDQGAIRARLDLLHNLAEDLGPLQAKIVRKKKTDTVDDEQEVDPIEAPKASLPGGLARFLN